MHISYISFSSKLDTPLSEVANVVPTCRRVFFVGENTINTLAYTTDLSHNSRKVSLCLISKHIL
jgi:hypothetical protein